MEPVSRKAQFFNMVQQDTVERQKRRLQLEELETEERKRQEESSLPRDTS